MDNSLFEKGYRQPAVKPVGEPRERKRLLTEPRAWMHYFDQTLHNQLAGQQPPDEAAFLKKATDYYRWAQTSLDEIDAAVLQSDIRTGYERDTNDLGFHRINAPFFLLWDQLLYGGTPFTPKHIADFQTTLAMSAIPSMRRHMKLEFSDSLTRDEELEKQLLKGELGEIDTQLTLSEITKQNPSIITLPAPASFEHGKYWSSRNIDLITFDTNRQLAHGIQVKNQTLNPHDPEKVYDPQYVSVVDSANELGNTYVSKDRRRRKTLPGLIAMGLISGRSHKDIPVNMRPAEYMRSRQIARELFKDRKSYLGIAATQLANRILPKLEGNPAISARKDAQIINPRFDSVEDTPA